MSPRKRLTPTLLCFLTVLCAASIAPPTARAQSNLKKTRLGIAATSVGFLPIYAAYHRGFFKDEGIDLEIILMSLGAANNAFFKGEIDYSAGLTGLALAAARNYPRLSSAQAFRSRTRQGRASPAHGRLRSWAASRAGARGCRCRASFGSGKCSRAA